MCIRLWRVWSFLRFPWQPNNIYTTTAFLCNKHLLFSWLGHPCSSFELCDSVIPDNACELSFTGHMHGQRTRLVSVIFFINGNVSKNSLWSHKIFVRGAYRKQGRFPWQYTNSVAFLAAILYFPQDAFFLICWGLLQYLVHAAFSAFWSEHFEIQKV